MDSKTALELAFLASNGISKTTGLRHAGMSLHYDVFIQSDTGGAIDSNIIHVEAYDDYDACMLALLAQSGRNRNDGGYESVSEEFYSTLQLKDGNTTHKVVAVVPLQVVSIEFEDAVYNAVHRRRIRMPFTDDYSNEVLLHYIVIP